MSTDTTTAPEWAIVEMMGHRRRAGRIEEVERFGAKMSGGIVLVTLPEWLATQRGLV